MRKTVKYVRKCEQRGEPRARMLYPSLPSGHCWLPPCKGAEHPLVLSFPLLHLLLRGLWGREREQEVRVRGRVDGSRCLSRGRCQAQTSRAPRLSMYKAFQVTHSPVSPFFLSWTHTHTTDDLPAVAI